MVRTVQTPTTNGLRKNRITQKTRLRVVRGALDEDAIILDDEEERNKVLASQGVDADDANEHHLQVALHAANHRKESRGKHAEPHIPTPDAAGVVEAYVSLYQPGKYKEPTTHLRFSETVEETVENGLAAGFTYFLDERDAEWIKKNNQEARGEGTSASASASTNGQFEDASMSSTRSGRTHHGRNMKGKAREPEHSCGSDTYSRVVVDEDEFELVMGLFEKLTEDKCPFIHLDLDAFPPFSDYEPTFAAPLPPATFATYTVPSSVPPPERLVAIARAVYPYWRERKVEREGKRVVPQLDYDDTQESSYICFRRRDAKPVRRTRASSTAYTDKLTRLRSELQMGFDIARLILQREELKREQAVVGKGVWHARCSLVKAAKNEEGIKSSDLGIDEALLYDKERVVKKPKLEAMSRILATPRRSSGLSPMTATPNRESHSPLTAHLELPGISLNTLSPLAYVAVQSAIKERYLDVQTNVEREIVSSRARDAGWEDVVDMPVQSLPLPSPEKYYRPCPPPSYSAVASPRFQTGIDPAKTLLNGDDMQELIHQAPAVPSDTTDNRPLDAINGSPSVTPSASKQQLHSLRLRTGRGGRLHLDRLIPAYHPYPLHRVERACWPRSSAFDRRRQALETAEEARWKSRDWRPEPSSSANLKKVSNADELGQNYWAHESIYGNPVTSKGKRKREGEDEVIGFEQIEDGLGIPTDADWEKGLASGSPGRLEPRSREGRSRAKLQKTEHQWSAGESTAEAIDHAWRIDERWRYDSDNSQNEDRFLLDDFQPKFLRTMVTLLSASDHEAVKTDAKYLTPPLIPNSGPKPFPSPSLSTEQERARLMGLKALRTPQPRPQGQVQVQAAQVQRHAPSHSPVNKRVPQPPAPAPNTAPPLPSPLPQQTAPRSPSTPQPVEEQIRRMTRHPQPAPEPSVPTVHVVSQATQRIPVAQPPPSPSPNGSIGNGFHPRSIPLGNGLSGDDAATVRVSSSMRPKAHTPSLHHQHQGALGAAVNGFTNSHTNVAFTPPQAPQNQHYGVMHQGHGHVHGLNPQQYAAVRNAFGTQQQHQTARPQMAMQMQLNGVSGNGNINLQMGPGNLNLKLPPSRPHLRMNGNPGGDVHGINVGGSPVPMHISPPRHNMGDPHARAPSANGHLMAPGHGRASPANGHLLGHASPHGHPAHPGSPHLQPGLVALPLHTTTPRPAPPFMHQQMVGGAGQGLQYS
ncbi:enhancer of polycomb-like-domain-containing protein [Gautieria morchelliformis]|nr:enhancer of polycomb-like-domain-containing protein [Gautieria morchelliformis]